MHLRKRIFLSSMYKIYFYDNIMNISGTSKKFSLSPLTGCGNALKIGR